jgi:hypothetical protein
MSTSGIPLFISKVMFVDDVAKDALRCVKGRASPAAPDEEGLLWDPIQMLTSITDLTITDF